jgi:hypothetical protein
LMGIALLMLMQDLGAEANSESDLPAA